MQRYFIDENYQPTVHLTDENYHHIVRVMRMKNGQEIFVVFADEMAIKAEITDITEESVIVTEIEKEMFQRELPIHITIASGFPKGEKLELIAQKATELGAFNFFVFPAETSVVKWDQKKQGKKVARLNKIIQEAAEQSHRQHLPRLESISPKELVNHFSDFDAVLIAYEESAKQGEQAQLAQTFQQLTAGQKLLVIFGPEGGLTPNEIEKYQLAGAKLAGLGPRILRTETAPLYLLSAASFYYELSSSTAH